MFDRQTRQGEVQDQPEPVMSLTSPVKGLRDPSGKPSARQAHTSTRAGQGRNLADLTIMVRCRQKIDALIEILN